MKPTKPVKKPRANAPGVKLLITAASVAATLGGWALISSNEPKPVPVPTPAPATDEAAAPVVTIKLAQLPTLVPEVALQSQIVTVNRPRAAAVRAAAVAAPVAAAPPQPAAPTTLVLRDVSAPQGNANAGRSGSPAPVVNTRSSR